MKTSEAKSPILRAIKERGSSVTKLAKLAGVNHSQASQTLRNLPNVGYRTRPKLAKHLTDDELAIVGWDVNGQKVGSPSPAAPAARASSPQGEDKTAIESGLRGSTALP